MRDIAALDRVLSMFGLAHCPEAARTRHRRGSNSKPFGFGEMTTAALDALRRLGRPASVAGTRLTDVYYSAASPVSSNSDLNIVSSW